MNFTYLQSESQKRKQILEGFLEKGFKTIDSILNEIKFHEKSTRKRITIKNFKQYYYKHPISYALMHDINCFLTGVLLKLKV